SGEVLMLGYMNKEALRLTLSNGEVWFYSRSRQELWHKGETSGNRLIMRELWRDCDSDTILVKAKPLGPVCHTGNKTCFFQKLTVQDIETGHQGVD
ncbi:phosphoribosyl-AMP cyclohydrolase, partial [Chloroflexota bacterium]